MAARLYLLDTSIVSHVVRQPHGPVAERIRDVGEDSVVTSIIVACELRYGAVKRGSRRLTRQLEAVLGAMTVLPLEFGIDAHYAAIRTARERIAQSRPQRARRQRKSFNDVYIPRPGARRRSGKQPDPPIRRDLLSTQPLCSIVYRAYNWWCKAGHPTYRAESQGSLGSS